jgi:hypothetical protein
MIMECHTPAELIDFVKCYQGVIMAKNNDRSVTVLSQEQYYQMSPAKVYRFHSPFLTFVDDFCEWPISDKTFEEKSREAMMRLPLTRSSLSMSSTLS